MQAGSLDLRIGARRLPFELLLIGAVLVTHFFAAIAPLNSLMYWYPTDDAFYYFQVARHIVSGLGVTFDGFNPANGFHPLWMLVCLPVFSLAAVDVVLPLRVLVMVMALLNAATAVLIYRLLIRAVHPGAAALGAVLWAFLPAIHEVTTLRGMESGIGAFSLVLLLSILYSQERRGWHALVFKDLLILGLAASLALFSRLDNIFLVAIVGVWVVFRRGGLNAYILAYLTTGTAAVFIAYFLRLGFTPQFPEYLPGLVIYLGITLAFRFIIYTLAGLHRPPVGESWLREALRIAAGASITSLLSGAGMLILTQLGWVGNFPRAVILIEGGMSLAVLVCLRFAAHRFDRRTLEEAVVGWKQISLAFPTWLRSGVAYALPLGVLLLGYILWNERVFGTFMPVSGQIKHWWGQAGDTIYGRPVQSFLGLLGFQNTGAEAWALLWMPFMNLASFTGDRIGWQVGLELLAYLGLTVWLWRDLRSGLNRALGLLLAAALLQVLYYNGTYYVNLRPWYWVNQMMLIVFFWALLVDGFLRRLGRWKRAGAWIRPAAGLAALAIFGSYTVYQFQLVPLSANARSTYPDLAETRALEQITEPGSRIGMTGGGVVAYFIQDRTIVNLDGLMNSNAYFTALKDGKGREMVDSFGLSYVFGGEYILLHSNPYYFSLADRLVEITSLGGGYVYAYRRPDSPQGEP
jgi:hypothetical protein